MDKVQHRARLLEDPRSKSSSKNVLFHWKRKLVGHVAGIRARRTRCVVCLQVHQITGMSPAMEGRGVIVGWRTKGCRGEHTRAVHVSRGAAAFDEIFLHYSRSDERAILRSFTVWVSLVDAADCDLGTFHVDLGELATVGNLNPKFGGKTMSLVLGGIASGGTLTLSVYCRMIEEENSESIGMRRERERNKSGCFSCLPDLSCLRTRPATGSARQASSIRSDRGFITIENSNSIVSNSATLTDDGEDDCDFITIEKGTVPSRRPPSDSFDGESVGADGDEKPCLLMEIAEEFDAEKVEDEFLRILEEKCWRGGDDVDDDVEVLRKGVEGSLSLSLDLSLDLDLNSLIKEAEIELAKAAQMWRGRVGAALVEKEEYEDLMKRLGANEESKNTTTTTNKNNRYNNNNNNNNSGCVLGRNGFGSPI
uniref:C2 NT-type domain-containing protein n=1 Tax=Ananas comosus var. bracteatus TaxID=296719 RepID=A0A6V7NQQ4_ANACO|nr:unnamed protein product [Ananas comosus var. bracteatus]